MLESLCRELNVCLAYRISGSNTGVLKHSNDFVSIEYLIYRIASSNIGVIQQIIELVFSIQNQWFQYQQSVCMNYRLQSQNPVFCFQNEWFQYRSPEAQNQYFKFDFTFLLDFFFRHTTITTNFFPLLWICSTNCGRSAKVFLSQVKSNFLYMQSMSPH